MSNTDTKLNILNNLKDKSAVKQKVFDNTLSVLSDVKKILKELEVDFNHKLEEADDRIKLDYQDNGIFSAQLKIAGDMIIVAMHSNIFEFDRSHGIWKTSYVQSDKTASYCGIVIIYNFV